MFTIVITTQGKQSYEEAQRVSVTDWGQKSRGKRSVTTPNSQ